MRRSIRSKGDRREWRPEKISVFNPCFAIPGFLVLLLSFCTPLSQAQSVANYTVAQTTGITYTSIAGTGISVAFWRNNTANQNDDNRSNPVNLGFDFWYLGTRYTTVSIGLNGFIDFSGAIYDGNGGAGTINCGGAIAYRQDPVAFSTSGCAATPPTTYSGTYIALAPLYTDLWVSGGTAALANSIKYQTTGVAPNRVFTVEYINYDDFAAGVASFNFQVKLYETTGKIEYVYGTMTGSGGGSMTTNYALGINNATMSAVPTAAQLLVQQVENTGTFSNAIKNNLTTIPTSNSMISFTSNTPANPGSVLTFSGVTNTDMTLNWTDWAANENGYVIYNSTDGVNYTFARQVAANTVSTTFNSLFGSLYFWRVYAVTEGTLSTPISGSQATLPGAVFVSAQTGPWNTGSTWLGGFVPTPGDNALISATHIVTLDGTNSITNLTVDGTLLMGDNGTNRTLTVLGDVTVSATGTFSSGSVATHSVILQGNMTNNGVVNFSPGGGSVTNITFNRNGNQTLSGTGATTNVNLITLNMGTSSTNIAEITSSNFSAPTDFLLLTNGTFRLSVPVSAVTLNIFSAGGTITNSTGLVMNSPNSTLNFLGTMNFQGDLTVNAGTVRVGDTADENLVSNGADIIINGGVVEVAGRLTRPSYISITNFTMTGGTMILNTMGSNDAAPPGGTATAYPFMMDVPGSKFIMTNGTIIIRQSGIGAGGAGINLGYNNTNVTNYTFSGGTIQIGDALTPAANSMKINTDRPIANLILFTTNGPTALLTSALTVSNAVTITPTTTLNSQNFNLTVGGTFSNDGTYTPGTNTTIFNGTTAVIGATVTTFTNVIVTGTLNSHVVNMNVTGNWTNNGGTFNPGSAMVTFNGAGAQAINGTAAAQTFNNFTINKAGGTLSSAGSTTSLTILGNYQQTLGNFTPIAAGTINVGGNWSHDAGTFTPNTNTVIFDGTGPQQITSTTLATETFYRLTVNKTPGTLLNTGGTITALTLTNNYTQTQGDFTPPAAFNVGGNWTHDAGVFTPGAGTVTFNGTGAQQISSSALTTENFNLLVVNKTAGTLLNTGGTLTTITTASNYTNTQGNFALPTFMYVGGNVTITSGTVTAASLIDLDGNWAHNGGTFTAGTSTVAFTGTAAQQISGVASETFYNLTINKTPSTLLNTAANPTTITVQNNLSQTEGDFTPPATLNVGGNWTHDAGVFTPGTGLVVFNGTGPQIISSATLTTESFNNLTVNKTAGSLLSAAPTFTMFTIAGNYINTQGNFLLPATVTVAGSVTLTAGTITSGNLVDVKVNWTNNGATFSPGTGTVTFTGTGAQNLNGTNLTQSFYNLTVNKSIGTTLTNGGSTTTINILNNYQQTQGNFTAIAAGTINVGGNWTHDAGTFTPSTGTVNFNGTGAQQISSVALATETFYRLSINKTAGTLLNTGANPTTISVTNNYTQTLGDFTPPGTLNVGGNWTHDAGTFTPGTGLVVFNGGGAQTISSTTLTTENFYNVTVNKGGGLLNTGGTLTTMAVANNYINTAGNFTMPATVTVGNDVTITAGTITAGDLIDVKRNWIRNGGTFTPGTGEVRFTGTAGQQISGIASQTFYNFTVNKTVATLLNTAANPTTITVTNNYTQSAGDFTPPATLNVGGHWTHDAGTFTPGTGTVAFNGAGAQVIASTAFATETFYNMTVNKAGGTLSTGGVITTITTNNNFTNTLGAFTAPTNLNVTAVFTITAGTVTGATAIDANSNVVLNGGTFVAPAMMNVFGNWSKAAAATFTQGAGTVTFDGTGAQQINGTSVTQTFNNVVVNKTAGILLNVGGSTTTLTLQNFTQTQGNFTPPATFNALGDVLLTTGTFTAGTNVNVSGNWTRNGGTFTPGTNTVTFNSSTVQQTIGGALSTTFGRLTINNTFVTSPQVVLAMPVTVTTALTMTNGQLQSDITNVILLANAATSNTGSAASFITGPMQYAMAVNAVTRTLNFPIGKNNVYGGAALAIRHGAATSYTYTAEVIASSAAALGYTLDPATTHVSGVRYWTIQRGLSVSPLTTDNANITTGVNGPRLTLFYELADDVTDPPNLTMVKNIGAGTTWFDIGGAASGAAPGNIAMAASSTNFTSFSNFTLANRLGGFNALPITLLDFTGRREGNRIALLWTTESEIGNDHFEIQRMVDGETFAMIGSVPGAGNSSATISYAFDDGNPVVGTNYYRLKQVDWDGTFTYSPIVAVDFTGLTESLQLVVVPNPSGPEEISVKINGSQLGPLLLRIFDTSGKVIGEREVSASMTQSIITWKFLSPLSSGTYVLQGIQGQTRAQDKFIVR